MQVNLQNANLGRRARKALIEYEGGTEGADLSHRGMATETMFASMHANFGGDDDDNDDDDEGSEGGDGQDDFGSDY